MSGENKTMYDVSETRSSLMPWALVIMLAEPGIGLSELTPCNRQASTFIAVGILLMPR